MASKRVIAICQSGGEFVKDRDGTLSYTGGEAYAIDIDLETQFSYFKKEVAEMFDFDAESMTIKYFLPGNKKTLITISKDKDLHRMVSFVKDPNTVYVFIIPEETHARNVPNLTVTRSSRSTVSEAMTPVVDDAVDVADAGMLNDNEDDVIDIDPSNLVPLKCTPISSYGNEHNKTAQPWENVITGVDQSFGSFDEFREALRRYSIALGFSYEYKKHNSHRVTVKCKSKGCKWMIYARLATTQLIYIKNMVDEHSCGATASKANCGATQGSVGSIIEDKLENCPNYRLKDIADDIQREFGIKLQYSEACHAEEITKEHLQGSFKDAYSCLPLLCERIRETNPGSVATFSTKEDLSFHRLFISFHACITGFQKGCRPLIFLDSSPLKSKDHGELLAAISADGDDGAFPVAFAIVDAETGDHWRWFLEELKTTLSPSLPVTFVADLRNGLKETLPEVFCHAYHGYCLHYLAEKLNEDLKGQFSHEARRLIVDDLYAAAYAPKLESFQRCINSIKVISPEAYDWVEKSKPEHWANAFFEGRRYNLLTSNFGQLFFNWVSEADELPIAQMIDVLQGKVMELIHSRRTESNQWRTRLTPLKEEKLEKEIMKARSIQILRSRGSMFEVHGESSHVVDIDNWGCNCKEWQINGLPCCHAIAVLQHIGKNPYDYCSKCFMLDTFQSTYAESIQPVPNIGNCVEDEESLPTIAVSPLPIKRSRGHSKMKSPVPVKTERRRLLCSKCKGLGHNKKTCKRSSDECKTS